MKPASDSLGFNPDDRMTIATINRRATAGGIAKTPGDAPTMRLTGTSFQMVESKVTQRRIAILDMATQSLGELWFQ